jgi:WD40-like Beta Propeller Repeat
MGRILLVALLLAGTLAQPADPGLRHASGAEPDGLLVLAVLSPERAMVADPRTGATSERRLAGGTLCHGPVLAVGHRVVLAGSRARRSVALSLPLSLAGRGRSLGAAETITASRSPGRVWLGTGRTRLSLREVDAAARPVAQTTLRAPAWSTVEAVVDDGFVVGHEAELSVRRRGFPTRTLRGAWLVAAGGSRLAWCRQGCHRLRVWSEDADRILEPPAGVRPIAGPPAAFSPDDRRLAVQVRTGGRDRVAVIDLTSGGWHVVPGRLVGYRSVAWSPSGRWLYFTGSRDRVLGWRTGAERPVALPIDTGGAVMSIATTAALRR